jgi:class 3 adenylate cyclase/tetratricopeptide (TPR) repeat protein
MPTCASCGRESPEGFRFCGACGAELAAARSREVRKTVTVLFADVTGSTALGERLDPEAVRRVMSRYFDEARAVLERYGGTVEKFIGDAVMAVFGVPTLHEDDARRAVGAAAAMRERLSSLNAELERDFGVRLDVRIGVNTGEVVTDEAASGERLVTGDAVNVAARLEAAAEPGEILLGDETRRLAGDVVETDALPPLELKGKAVPVGAHRLVRVDGAQPLGRPDAPLVGRREELARLRAAMGAALTERRCRLVTLLGPPGIGKSRLARELAADVGDEATALTGRCLPYGEGITYWALREIFAAAGAEAELDAALAADAPEEVAWAVRKALERRARRRPLLLVIEDVHWAEPTLLDLLEHLLDWTRDAPCLLLCPARPELLDARPAWGAARPNAEVLRLDPLAADEADELIATRAGATRLDDGARARILEVAEGNPLFVEQLLALMSEAGDAHGVPSTIQALLAARVDALPDDERAILERASVVGLEFEWEALAALAPDGRRPRGAQLAALARKELIRPHEATEDAFRFRHILIRDAAYERLPKERRADLHERFADWLGAGGAELDDIVGYHLEQASRSLAALGPPGERGWRLAARAAGQLAGSGRRADARGDMATAAGLLERAVALLPEDDPGRLALLPALGRALREAGRLDRADAVLSEAIERARAADEPALVADAAVARMSLRFHRRGATRADLVREIERALPVFRATGDGAGLARALAQSGKLRLWAGEAAAAIEDLQDAARHARDAGDLAQEADALDYALTAICEGPTHVDEALARIEAIRPRASGNRRLELALLNTMAAVEAMRGRLAVARDRLAEARALGEEHGLRVILATHTSRVTASAEMLSGDPGAAERALRPACETLERIGELGYLSSVAPLLAEAVAAQGRDEEAVALTERWRPERLTVREDADAWVGWRRVRARLLARRGEVGEALRLAEAAVAAASRTDFLTAHATALADLAEVLRLAGHPEEAASALRAALRLFERKGNVAAARALGAAARP